MNQMQLFGESTVKQMKEIVKAKGVTAAFGIDLGTTNSAIALVPAGTAPVIIPLEHGNTLPSCVMWNGGNSFTVGKEAYEKRYDPSVIYSVKRFMQDTDKIITLHHGNDIKEMTPAEVSAEILKALVKQTNGIYGEVKDVVITVPAKFNEIGRQHTREACELAGLNLLGIIAEPTAAAMCYELKPEEGNVKDILIYDLGGGTFDVSLVRISLGSDMTKVDELYGVPASLREKCTGKVIKAIGGDGDTHLGGDDVDRHTYEIVKKQLEDSLVDTSRISIEEESRVILLLESLKKLGIDGQTRIPITLDKGLNTEEVVEAVITYNTFVEGLRPTYNRTRKIIENVRRANRTNANMIILVGGSTKSKILKKFLQEDYPTFTINDAFPQDEAVALGAGIHSRFLKFRDNNISIFDSLIDSIGIVAADRVLPVISKGSTFPVSRSKMFTNTVDNQKSIKVTVVQGNSSLLEECCVLGELVIDNLPPVPEGTLNIEIVLSINVNGLLMCEVIIQEIGSTEAPIKRGLKLALNSNVEAPKQLSREERLVIRWKALAKRKGGNFGKQLLQLVDAYPGSVTQEEIMTFIKEGTELNVGE